MGKIRIWVCLFFAQAAFGAAIDLDEVEKALKGNGLRGWIHGAAHDFRQYVFTYRAGDFFTHAEFSLLPANARVRAALKETQRHDEVVLHGRFANNPSPQKHILVEKLEVLKDFDPGAGVPPHVREARLPDDLLNETSALAMVHAVAAEGRILVIEYKDAVVPVSVEDPKVSSTLFRGDKVRIHYQVQTSPRLPAHLVLDSNAATPIEVLDRVADQHGRALTLEGSLVYFPKSPQISFGVFALQKVDADGLKRNYTLVNFDDPVVFNAIRAKLETEWNARAATAINGRNCLVNPAVRVRASGEGNVVSPNQANPQILLDGPDAVEFLPVEKD